MTIELDDVNSGYNLQKINSNFQKIEDCINDELLHRAETGVPGEAMMERDLDMNNHSILNIKVDANKPGSLITVGEADLRYYNVDGDTLRGNMDADSYKINNLGAPLASTDAARKLEVDSETSARQAADANLQAQMTGEVPLEASAFSEISWHDRDIKNSVTIPANKNAWSFGPQMEIKQGQAVTVSEGSSWTIADGRLVEDEDLHNLIADTITTPDGLTSVSITELDALGPDVEGLDIRLTAEENKVQSVALGGTGATSATSARTNLGFVALGIGGAAPATASLDWQQFDFVPSQEGYVAANNMVNTPSGIDTSGWGTTPVCFNVIGFDGPIMTIECWLSHVTNSLFRRYQVRISGAKGSRIFAVRQIFTSADVVPITNGGTGNTTGLAAKATALATARSIRTNLASTSMATFDGTVNITPGVTGILGRANGGTGQSDVSYLRAENQGNVSLASSAFIKLTPTVVTDTKSAYVTGNWTCPETGYYQFAGFMRIIGNGTAEMKAMLKIDSSTAPTATYVPGQTAGAQFNGLSGAGEAFLNLSCILYVTAGTALSLYGYHNYASDLNSSQQALQIIRIA